MKYLVIILSLAIFSFPGCSINIKNDKSKPNIILINADDMGYGDAGCYGGTNLVPTPNIDRLAREGVLFTDAYVTGPTCGPSRYGLLLGVYQQRYGIRSNKDCLLPPRSDIEGHSSIISESQVINQPLHNAGYITGMVGKWNLPGYPETTFDETKSVMDFGGHYWPDETGHYPGVDEPQPAGMPGYHENTWGPVRDGDEYLTDRLGRQSVEFIKKNSDKPFFLYLAFNAPHTPLQAKKAHAGAVAHLKSEPLRLYGAMMMAMDENIGRVLDALDKLKLTKNTMVVFTSDNGPNLAGKQYVEWPEDWPIGLLGSAGPLKGHKGQFWEGGIRVPLIIRWPERLKSGQIFKDPVSVLDLYPTFCAAAGTLASKGSAQDGVDLLPFLTGEKRQSPHGNLFWGYSVSNGAIRNGKWKVMISGNTIRLFDLENDIGEKSDLAIKYPDRTSELLEDYKNFWLQMPPGLGIK